jgi:hypothetical protein
MKTGIWRIVAMALAVAAAVLSADVVQAQDITVRGRVIGPDGAALAAQRVVLHRVDASGGATIAETLSAEDGSFVLDAADASDTTAVLFVAARYEDELYIGPPFRAGDMTSLDQQIQVGVPGMSATALMEQDGGVPMPRSPQPQAVPNWVLILVPLLGIAAVGIYALVPRNRLPEDRARLIRVAELDERMESAPPAQRESLVAERQRLVAEIRGD